MTIKEILNQIGIRITSETDAGFAQFCPIYRGSSNQKGASICLKSGWVTDWSENSKFPIEVLVKRVTGKEMSKAEILKYQAEIQPLEIEEKEVQYWSKDSLIHLLPDHSYWMGRGISKETLDFFRGGVSHGGKLIRRYVWPVFDRHQRIIGFTGRDLTGKSDMKYKHEGPSTSFLFGLFNERDGEMPVLNSIIKNSHIIIVEGPSDSVACFDEGLYNVVPMTGLNISKNLLSFLLAINPKKITLASNRDDNFRGQNAAVKNYTKLRDHFSDEVLEIKFPVGNDLAEKKDEIKNFLDLPPANVLNEFRLKYIRCERDKKNKVKGAVKMSKKEIEVGKDLKK